MLLNTVRWGLGIVVVSLLLHYSSPTAFADTLLELPRSDARLFCPNDLASTPLVSPILAVALPQDKNDKKVQHVAPPRAEKPSHSLNADTLFGIINEYRTQIGLAPFQKDQAICDIAKQRGPALDYEVETGTIHAGFRQLNLPYWATENMKYGGNEQEMFNWWMNSYIHRKAIEGSFRYSCGECYGNSCAQIFTDYQPK